MTVEKVPMTLQGKRKLEAELKQLTSVERSSVIRAIEVARGHGDLSENADYSAAKERQSFIEGRIQEINAKLARAEVIDPTSVKSERVVFGATVNVLDQESGKSLQVQIVGVDEANLKEGKISISSPVARALIGRTQGEEVIVHAPKGQLYYEILSIEYR